MKIWVCTNNLQCDHWNILNAAFIIYEHEEFEAWLVLFWYEELYNWVWLTYTPNINSVWPWHVVNTLKPNNIEGYISPPPIRVEIMDDSDRYVRKVFAHAN